MPRINSIPFAAAERSLRAKGLLPTTLSSEELKGIGADIRERAMFSARTDYASHLQTIQDQVDKMIEGKTDPATARQELQDSLDRLDYKPEVGAEGTITDLRSDQRLDLIIKTNREMVQGYGAWEQSQATLDSYPAQELIRAEGRKVPREWYQRWLDAGGELYPGNPEGLPLSEDGQGRCIALVNDPIWSAISEFGLPYPPFDFGSGVDVRPVSLAECLALGILTGDEDTAEPEDRGLNEGLEAAAPVAEGPLRDELLRDLGDDYEFVGDTLTRK
jgi:hypothetical protein